MRKCEQLLARKANLSAIEESQTAIHYLLQILDQHGNQYQCEPLWSEAQQSFREAEDFTVAQRMASDPQFLVRLVESHESRVLKEADVSQLSPLAAAQHYHRHTQNRLVLASAGHPWASELYYVLGRALQARADEGGDAADALRQRAVTYYRAAREIMPANSMATNQLGYLLLTMDRPTDAREALLAATHSGGTIASWQNLVEANRRLGDSAGHSWAMQNFAALNRRMPAQSPNPPYVELAPHQFAMLSPHDSGPKLPQSAPANSMQPGVQPSQPSTTGRGYTANRFGNAPAVR